MRILAFSAFTMGFDKSTPILMADDTVKLLSDVRVGDYVKDGFNRAIKVTYLSSFDKSIYYEYNHLAFSSTDDSSYVSRYTTSDQLLCLQPTDHQPNLTTKGVKKTVKWLSHCTPTPFDSTNTIRTAITPNLNLFNNPILTSSIPPLQENVPISVRTKVQEMIVVSNSKGCKRFIPFHYSRITSNT